MAALTETDIANMALGILEDAQIGSLNEDTTAARIMKLHYETVREAELTLHAWSFAAVFPSADLVATDTGEEGEQRYLYQVPSDFLRPVWLTRDGLPDGVPVSFSIWADGIRTDFEGPLTLPYIANITDPNDWPALFTQAFAAALAIPAAHPITHKSSMIEIAQKAYDRAIERATTVNAFLKQGRPHVQSWAVQRGDLRYWRA